ncbi:MAG: ATP-binding protein, partial [Bacteroidota bacterium]
MGQLLRTLVVEDNESDAALMRYYLQKADYDLYFERVETANSMRNALQNDTWDIIFCDYNLPQFDAPAALTILHESKLDIPFIVVSGAIGEETAVNIMKAGANDCVMKNNLRRLQPVIARELAEAAIRKKQRRSEKIQSVLYSISYAIVTTNDLQALIAIIREQLGTLIDTTNFFVAIYDKKSDMITLPYMADQRDRIISVPAGKTLTAHVIRTKKSLLANRAMLDKMEAEGLIQTVGEKAMVWLGVPLIKEDEVIGVVAVQNYENENALTINEVEILEFVSDQILLSIDRKKSEQDLRESLARAEESDRLKSTFLANISHEIRTPMHGIMGFSEYLEDESLTPEERIEYSQLIAENCRILLKILDGIINISRLDTNQVILNATAFNANGILTGFFESLSEDIKKSGKTALKIELVKELPDNDSKIMADKEKFMIILGNLLNNAIKFTEEGTIRFGYRLVENKMQFYVSDTGKGIPKEMHEVIFEKFRQADETVSRSFGGNGVGLSISKGLVELMG